MVQVVDVDKLSDAELRTKLMEYGFPALPITGSTRNVMVKKLKLLLGNMDNPDSRRSLAKYSSEDDSEPEVKVSKTKRRVTMAAPPVPSVSLAAPTVKKTTRIVETTIEEDVPKKTTRASTSAAINSSSSISSRTSRILRNAQDDFDTGSESDSELKNKVDFYSFSLEKPSAFSSPVLTSDGATERLNQIRSRLSLGSPTYSSSSGRGNVAVAGAADKVETPFLSNFTRRLSQLSAAKQNDVHVKEELNNGASGVASRAPLYVRSSLRQPYQRSVDLKGKYGNLVKDNLVPFAVLGVALLFFVFLGFIYLGMRSDTSLETLGIKVAYCDPPNSNSGNCVNENESQQALNLLKPLKAELAERGVKRFCENQNLEDRMDDKDVVKFVEKKFGFTDQQKILEDLHNLKLLILQNPKWGISIVNSRDKNVEFDDILVRKIDQLIGFEKLNNPTYLTISNPEIPLTCTVKNRFLCTLKTTLIISTIFALVYAANFGYKKYTEHLRRRQSEVVSMVEKILEVLQQNDGENSDYVVINHVRDMLIPVNERRTVEKIWKRAVDFIDENESRVRKEVQVVQGEEYLVWRWIGSSNLSANFKNKSWQGQAFETQTGAVNSLPCSPTPCLKIRGMIEDGDRNRQMIREAVMSKCAQKCRILHCAVDTAMKCVYLKCADTSDAAIAYQNLHGWWYAGQLVTVKYLRLERYMHRFPDSPTVGPPFLKTTLANTEGFWAS